MICRQKKPDRSCAPVSPFTTHCGIQALAPERWWQFRASAVSAISVRRTRGKWDFHTVALGRGKDKDRWPESWERTDTSIPGAVDTVAELQKLGGARVILATAPSAKAISAVVEGLRREWESAGAGRARDPLTRKRDAVNHGATIDLRPVFRHGQGFARYLRIQRVDWRAPDD